jgi:exodeoxyribonuclease-5
MQYAQFAADAGLGAATILEVEIAVAPKADAVAELKKAIEKVLAPAPAIVLTAGQDKAKAEIMAAMAKGDHHVLLGFAGTGKTTLMRVVVREMLEAGKRVAVCAPTNKAVSVLERNIRAAAIEAPCLTIYKLLGLTPGSDDEKRKPKRVGKNKALHYDVVILDECSMVSSDLMEWINKDLRRHFVLYVGDPAQLPPVGEKLSETFATPSCSMLSEIMRQASDNPVIALATDVREMIETATPDWGRFAPVDDGGDFGIFCPGVDAQAWVDDALEHHHRRPGRRGDDQHQ